MKVFLIAGEESGDVLGGDLMQAMQMRYPHARFEFKGIGGQRMQAQGLSCLFPMEELSVMGITEILPKIGSLMKRMTEAARAIKQFQPDVLITIDAPDFCFRVVRKVQKMGHYVPLKVHYVAPTVWAWRPKRAEKVARLYDAIFCLLPFEPPYFEKEGMKAIFTGHPMCQRLRGITGDDFIEKYTIAPEAKKIGVLFGSRRGEIQRMGAVFVAALRQLIEADHTQKYHIIVPTLPHLKDDVEVLVKDLPADVTMITNEDEKYQAMAACDAAVATSGTVGLELAVLNIPHIIGYKMNQLTYEIGKRLITTKYAHLANIILQERIVPELIQADCTSENISRELQDVIFNDTIMTLQKEKFALVREIIKGADNISPSDTCAHFIMQNFNG